MASVFASRCIGIFCFSIAIVMGLFGSTGSVKETSGAFSRLPSPICKIVRDEWGETAKEQKGEGMLCLFALLGMVPLWLSRRKGFSPREVLRVCTESWRRLCNDPSGTDVFQALTDSLVNELGLSSAVLVQWDETGEAKILGLAPCCEGQGNLLSLPFSGESMVAALPAEGQILEGEALKGWLRRLLPIQQRLPLDSLEGSGWLAPLTFNHRPLGAMLLVRRHPFLPQEIPLMEQLCQQVAMMLVMAQRRLKHPSDDSFPDRLQRRFLQLLREVEQAESVEAKTWSVLQAALEGLGVTRVCLWRLNRRSERLYCTLAVGRAGLENFGKGWLVRSFEGCAHYLATLERERCLVVPDVRNDERVAELRAVLGERVIAFAAAPVRIGGNIVAILECEVEHLRHWTAEERMFLTELADLLTRLWLEDQRQRRERYLETLSNIALQLLAVTEWQGAVPAILADLGSVLKVDIGFIAQGLKEGEETTLTPLYCFSAGGEHPSEKLERFLRSCLNAQVFSALEQGQEVTLTVSALTDEQKAYWQGLSWQSMLLLPLWVESRFWGVLGFIQTRYERFWSDMDITVLRVASALLGSAIERQLALERQLEQERQFRDLFENAVIGVYRSTPEGHFLMANRTLAHINSYDTVDELMALHIPDQIYADPEDRRRFQRLMEEQGFVADFRYPIKRKDGSIGWVAKWARAGRDATGQVRYYEGFVLDITEQVLLAQRLQGLQEIAHNLVARLDLESILTIAVQGLSHLYPESAVVIWQHLPEQQGYLTAKANEAGQEWLQGVGQKVGSVLPRHPFHPLEQRLRQGETVTIDAAADPILSERGNWGRFRAAFLKGLGTVDQFWGILMVLQEQKPFADHDLTFLNSFCDYLSIAIRNATLFQQLQQAYQELQAMQERVMEQERLRALGQMASGIAHDINNALVPIQGFAELLLEHDDPTVQNAAQVIFKAARDITTVVQRMREFYRPRTKEEPLEPLDLNALCQDALAMTRPRWHNIPQERGVVIEPRLELREDLPPVVGIPNEVRQAIVNLILNAADAMPQGGTLTLRTYKAEREGRLWAVVEVSDTGIGMDEETRRRAIEPFFTTKGEGGSGLGLSVVYGTMQRHEGLLEIESEPGKGTTVRLWFPSKKAAMEMATVGKVPPMRLLVIDDEPFVREMVASLLQRDGHWVSTAPDSEQGIAIFEKALKGGEPFDVVITDLGMPQKDGFAVARAIKALSPFTPILLLSGWGFRLQGEEMRSLIDEVLAKPATHQQLRRALYNLWRRRHASEGNSD